MADSEDTSGAHAATSKLVNVRHVERMDASASANPCETVTSSHKRYSFCFCSLQGKEIEPSWADMAEASSPNGAPLPAAMPTSATKQDDDNSNSADAEPADGHGDHSHDESAAESAAGTRGRGAQSAQKADGPPEFSRRFGMSWLHDDRGGPDDGKSGRGRGGGRGGRGRGGGGRGGRRLWGDDDGMDKWTHDKWERIDDVGDAGGDHQDEYEAPHWHKAGRGGRHPDVDRRTVDERRPVIAPPRQLTPSKGAAVDNGSKSRTPAQSSDLDPVGAGSRRQAEGSEAQQQQQAPGAASGGYAGFASAAAATTEQSYGRGGYQGSSGRGGGRGGRGGYPQQQGQQYGRGGAQASASSARTPTKGNAPSSAAKSAMSSPSFDPSSAISAPEFQPSGGYAGYDHGQQAVDGGYDAAGYDPSQQSIDNAGAYGQQQYQTAEGYYYVADGSGAQAGSAAVAAGAQAMPGAGAGMPFQYPGLPMISGSAVAAAQQLYGQAAGANGMQMQMGVPGYGPYGMQPGLAGLAGAMGQMALGGQPMGGLHHMMGYHPAAYQAAMAAQQQQQQQIDGAQSYAMQYGQVPQQQQQAVDGYYDAAGGYQLPGSSASMAALAASAQEFTPAFAGSSDAAAPQQQLPLPSDARSSNWGDEVEAAGNDRGAPSPARQQQQHQQQGDGRRGRDQGQGQSHGGRAGSAPSPQQQQQSRQLNSYKDAILHANAAKAQQQSSGGGEGGGYGQQNHQQRQHHDRDRQGSSGGSTRGASGSSGGGVYGGYRPPRQ